MGATTQQKKKKETKNPMIKRILGVSNVLVLLYMIASRTYRRETSC